MFDNLPLLFRYMLILISSQGVRVVSIILLGIFTGFCLSLWFHSHTYNAFISKLSVIAEMHWKELFTFSSTRLGMASALRVKMTDSAVPCVTGHLFPTELDD